MLAPQTALATAHTSLAQRLLSFGMGGVEGLADRHAVYRAAEGQVLRAVILVGYAVEVGRGAGLELLDDDLPPPGGKRDLRPIVGAMSEGEGVRLALAHGANMCVALC